MKKMLMFVAAIALASGMQAAQLMWSFQATKSAATAFNGCTVYMVFADDMPATITSLADITDASKSQAKFNVGSKSASATATYQDANLATGDYQIYAFLVKDNEYFQTGPLPVTAVGDGSDGNPAGTPSLATFATGTALATASNWKSAGDGAPEPTSGLLLLVGGALLGLRRKRA